MWDQYWPLGTANNVNSGHNNINNGDMSSGKKFCLWMRAITTFPMLMAKSENGDVNMNVIPTAALCRPTDGAGVVWQYGAGEVWRYGVGLHSTTEHNYMSSDNELMPLCTKMMSSTTKLFPSLLPTHGQGNTGVAACTTSQFCCGQPYHQIWHLSNTSGMKSDVACRLADIIRISRRWKQHWYTNGTHSLRHSSNGLWTQWGDVVLPVWMPGVVTHDTDTDTATCRLFQKI